MQKRNNIKMALTWNFKIVHLPLLLLSGVTSIELRAADAIPYREALTDAAVNETSISNIGSQALVLGNGELNALVYSVGNDLRLRLAKNDVWDLRVDTKNDPPLPVIDVAKGKVVSVHAAAGSWNTPYPTALP